jgi:hypothetical protein
MPRVVTAGDADPDAAATSGGFLIERNRVLVDGDSSPAGGRWRLYL